MIKYKELSKGDKIIVGEKQYTIDDATPLEIQKAVFDVEIFEENPVQWFKKTSWFFYWSDLSQENEELRLSLHIIMCALTVTKSAKELYEIEIDSKKMEPKDIKSKWFNSFLENIYFYLFVLNATNILEEELFGMLSQPFYYVSPNDKKKVIKDFLNNYRIRKSVYIDYKGNNGPVYEYGKEIGKLLGIKDIVFTSVITNLSLKDLNRQVEFYKSTIGNKINWEELIEKYF